jgi:hypothetical protein
MPVGDANDDGSTTHIRIDEGPFKDVIYRYGAVRFEENEEKETCTLTYQFDIIDSANNNKEELEANKDFEKTIGDLLVGFIDEYIDNNKDMLDKRRKENTDD